MEQGSVQQTGTTEPYKEEDIAVMRSQLMADAEAEGGEAEVLTGDHHSEREPPGTQGRPSHSVRMLRPVDLYAQLGAEQSKGLMGPSH